MGAATLRKLSAVGYRLAAVDVDSERLSRAMQGLETDAVAYVLDATKELDVRDAVKRIESEQGPIETLVNLIGWCELHPFADEHSAYWKKVVSINYESVLYLTHAVLPGMISRGSGSIVYVASDAGRVGQGGEAVYAGTKGAVIAFAKSLAREVARYGIRVNCTAPGPTATALESGLDQGVIERVVRQTPFRRLAMPEEQAAAIAFLCSPDSAFITGQTLSVSGGLTMC